MFMHCLSHECYCKKKSYLFDGVTDLVTLNTCIFSVNITSPQHVHIVQNLKKTHACRTPNLDSINTSNKVNEFFL